ncbi:tyrosine-type recombinase/integrase [Streptomyces sp. wa53]|uniref:tyrosine-type recombinase/integrase n=1 Tax=Streptomyces sp. wa53 TaxID=1828268 RepID=UPI003C7C8406
MSQPLGGGASEVRPAMRHADGPALWPSERGRRVGLQRLDSRFAAYRDDLGLDPVLDFHSLRRSYVTHLIEGGIDPLFLQQQAGHDHASTTSIYTNSQELHLTGEKPQVAWSRQETEGLHSLYELAS